MEELEEVQFYVPKFSKTMEISRSQCLGGY